jgi:hypothetical protein
MHNQWLIYVQMDLWLVLHLCARVNKHTARISTHTSCTDTPARISRYLSIYLHAPVYFLARTIDILSCEHKSYEFTLIDHKKELSAFAKIQDTHLSRVDHSRSMKVALRGECYGEYVLKLWTIRCQDAGQPRASGTTPKGPITEEIDNRRDVSSAIVYKLTNLISDGCHTVRSLMELRNCCQSSVVPVARQLAKVSGQRSNFRKYLVMYNVTIV